MSLAILIVCYGFYKDNGFFFITPAVFDAVSIFEKDTGLVLYSKN